MNKSEKKGKGLTKSNTLEVPQTPGESVGGSSAGTKSHFSSSDFAKPQQSVDSFHNKMSAYLALRGTVSLQAFKIQDTKAEGEEDEGEEDEEVKQSLEAINSMVEEYYKFVNYAWPAKWQTLSDIPLSKDIAGSVSGKEKHRRVIRKQLLEDYQMMKDMGTVTIEAIQDKDDLADRIARIFPEILIIWQEAVYKDDQIIQGRALSEADCRKYWNQALSMIFTSNDIEASPQVICERMVGYSVSEPERLGNEGDKIKAYEGVEKHFAFVNTLRRKTKCDLKEFSEKRKDTDLQAIKELSNALAKQATADAGLAGNMDFDRYVAPRAEKESKRGVPDAVVFIAYDSESTSASPSDINKMAFIHAGDSHHTTTTKNPNILSNPLNSSIGFPFDEARANWKKRKHDTGSTVDEVQETVKVPASKFSNKTREQSAESRQLLIPLLVVEHKKQKYVEDTLALNQCKLYSINAAIFMDKLGMKPQPIFGLVTHGRYGYITLTWKFKHGIALFEWNIARLDITQPMDCLRLHIFLLRLHKYGTELRESTLKDSEGSELPELAATFFKIVKSEELDPNFKWKKDTGKADKSTGNEAGKRPDNAKSTGNKQRATKAKGKLYQQLSSQLADLLGQRYMTTAGSHKNTLLEEKKKSETIVLDNHTRIAEVLRELE
ncbi:hypothetical protein H0H92_004551 [Tricholoma furcatifolium]|nr:hypothetical protein H0H92_004551 [Tricholoma furcatifolium]